jgi:hypothetical protein
MTYAIAPHQALRVPYRQPDRVTHDASAGLGGGRPLRLRHARRWGPELCFHLPKRGSLAAGGGIPGKASRDCRPGEQSKDQQTATGFQCPLHFLSHSFVGLRSSFRHLVGLRATRHLPANSLLSIASSKAPNPPPGHLTAHPTAEFARQLTEASGTSATNADGSVTIDNVALNPHASVAFAQILNTKRFGQWRR